MEKLFVPYEIAVKLKEKGFNDICLAVYVPLKDGTAEFEIGESDANKKGRSLVSAPLYQQVTDWLREKHGIYIEMQVEGVERGEIVTRDTYYRTFIWTVGKERPRPADDIGAQDYYVILEETIKQALDELD